MGFTKWVPSFLLVSTFTQASLIPKKYQAQHLARQVDTSDADITVELALTSDITIDDLAAELEVDTPCLKLANPPTIDPDAANRAIVPYSCCGTSCKGWFCSKRPQCAGQSTSSAPEQTTGTSTTCVSTLTTSIATTEPDTGTTSSDIETIPTFTDADPTATGATTSVNPEGQTFISQSGVIATLPTGLTTPTTIVSGGQTITYIPSDPVPSDQPIPTDQPAPSPPTDSETLITTTDSVGQTVISNTGGAVTLPTGLSDTTLVTLPDGGVVTFVPPTTSVDPPDVPVVTTTNTAGETVISSTGAGFTIATGLTTPIIVTNSEGGVITFTPTPSETVPAPSGNVTDTTTTNTAGETVIGSFTIPTGISTPVTLTNGDAVVTTFTPLPPTNPTEPLPTTEPAPTTTPQPPPPDAIIPITTPVPEPTATDEGTIIPCNLWFFDSCIEFGDISIGGWLFNLPTGIRPPGPPPAITFPPTLSISFTISGTLPEWPEITIGPDRLPTYSPKPSDQPDNQCETESAEICLTRTSFGVDTATVTTTTAVLSTCATILGCDVSDSATTTSATSSASEYPYVCGPRSAGVAKRTAASVLSTTTSAPLALNGKTVEDVTSSDLITHGGNLTLSKRDIPSEPESDGIDDFYGFVGENGNTVNVELAIINNEYISSSSFRPFDNTEMNLLVRQLGGCTSLVVVSRLGAYVTHFWETSFTDPIRNGAFQREIIDYVNTGRAGGEADTESLATLVQRGVFAPEAFPSIFIMSPAGYDRDINPEIRNEDGVIVQEQTPDPDRESLRVSEPNALFAGQLGTLETTLGQLLPGVAPQRFIYRRNNIEGALDYGAYGASTTLYSNNQELDPAVRFNPDDPDAGVLPDPQKAAWQVWMQEKLMGQDIWDATPEQGGACPLPGAPGRKRQDGGVCSSVGSTATDTSPTESPTDQPPPTTEPAPTTTESTVNPTITTSSTLNPDFPTLAPTGITTPPGSSCVSTTIVTECAPGPQPSQSACVSSAVCASFTATVTSPTTTTDVPSPPPPPEVPEGVVILIASDADCLNVVQIVTLDQLGETYAPTGDTKFGCFQVQSVSESVGGSGAGLQAWASNQCFTDQGDDPTQFQDYPDPAALVGTFQSPFPIGCLQLS